jgi:ABC-2 type transport system ATP-binding protein
VVTVSGLAAEKVVAVLSERGVPFSEVSAYRASLESAYLELTRDAVEYRALAAPETAQNAPEAAPSAPEVAR